MECVIETKANVILDFIHGLRGEVQVTFDALSELQPTPGRTRRTAIASLRRSRRSDGRKPRQRMLFR
jgi:hypothetical protein